MELHVSKNYYVVDVGTPQKSYFWGNDELLQYMKGVPATLDVCFVNKADPGVIETMVSSTEYEVYLLAPLTTSGTSTSMNYLPGRISLISGARFIPTPASGDRTLPAGLSQNDALLVEMSSTLGGWCATSDLGVVAYAHQSGVPVVYALDLNERQLLSHPNSAFQKSFWKRLHKKMTKLFS